MYRRWGYRRNLPLLLLCNSWFTSGGLQKHFLSTDLFWATFLRYFYAWCLQQGEEGLLLYRHIHVAKLQGLPGSPGLEPLN